MSSPDHSQSSLGSPPSPDNPIMNVHLQQYRNVLKPYVENAITAIIAQARSNNDLDSVEEWFDKSFIPEVQTVANFELSKKRLAKNVSKRLRMGGTTKRRKRRRS